MVVDPKHFTECHEFSVYGTEAGFKVAKSKSRKGSLSSKVRFQVFSRDGYRCIYCGATGAETALHIDHKVSVADGGTDEMANLATACERCNLGKGARSVTDD
ncbi:MAG: HNH endonuclease [Candidatus Competibacteraceae bacterium]|nr:MAG: HNH endonuclease [Candidatus Competibacteraceae bacterium]